MTDASWQLDLADDDVYADEVRPSQGQAWPTLTPGRDERFVVAFGDTPATSGLARDAKQRFEAVRIYVESAREDAVKIVQTRDGSPRYTERLNASDPSSLVVGFLPSSDLQNRNGQQFWGVLLEGTDVSNAVPTSRAIELRVVVLGLLDDYPTRTDIEDLSKSLL